MYRRSYSCPEINKVTSQSQADIPVYRFPNFHVSKVGYWSWSKYISALWWNKLFPCALLLWSGGRKQEKSTPGSWRVSWRDKERFCILLPSMLTIVLPCNNSRLLELLYFSASSPPDSYVCNTANCPAFCLFLWPALFSTLISVFVCTVDFWLSASLYKLCFQTRTSLVYFCWIGLILFVLNIDCPVYWIAFICTVRWLLILVCLSTNCLKNVFDVNLLQLVPLSGLWPSPPFGLWEIILHSSWGSIHPVWFLHWVLLVDRTSQSMSHHMSSSPTTFPSFHVFCGLFLKQLNWTRLLAFKNSLKRKNLNFARDPIPSINSPSLRSAVPF